MQKCSSVRNCCIYLYISLRYGWQLYTVNYGHLQIHHQQSGRAAPLLLNAINIQHLYIIYIHICTCRLLAKAVKMWENVHTLKNKYQELFPPTDAFVSQQCQLLPLLSNRFLSLSPSLMTLLTTVRFCSHWQNFLKHFSICYLVFICWYFFIYFVYLKVYFCTYSFSQLNTASIEKYIFFHAFFRLFAQCFLRRCLWDLVVISIYLRLWWLVTLMAIPPVAFASWHSW